MIVNILLLIYYKYLHFILSCFKLSEFGADPISLPLGISFFTFTQITYVADMYYRKTNPSGFINYSLFVNYFPHLISGPIIHHKNMISQFKWQHPKETCNNFYALGLGFLIFGLFKKVVIADRLVMIIDPDFFSSIKNINTIEAWKNILAYTFQLYFDFSGYSDIGNWYF